MKNTNSRVAMMIVLVPRLYLFCTVALRRGAPIYYLIVPSGPGPLSDPVVPLNIYCLVIILHSALQPSVLHPHAEQQQKAYSRVDQLPHMNTNTQIKRGLKKKKKNNILQIRRSASDLYTRTHFIRYKLFIKKEKEKKICVKKTNKKTFNQTHKTSHINTHLCCSLLVGTIFRYLHCSVAIFLCLLGFLLQENEEKVQKK